MLCTTPFPEQLLAAFERAKQIQAEISRISQKRLSTFYTQPGAAILLAGLTIQSPADVVLDPACGSGILLLAALAWKQELSKVAPKTTKEAPIVKDLLGVEIDLVAAETARKILASIQSSGSASQPQIFAGDAFKAVFPQVDVILMNPPFTRQERLTEEDLRGISEKLAATGIQHYYDSQMSLSAIFLLAMDGYLRSGGRMGLVIPAATFSSRYSRQLLQFFQDRHYSIRWLMEVLGENSAFSIDCRYKEYLVVLEKGTAAPDSPTMLTLTEVPDCARAVALSTALQSHQLTSTPLIPWMGTIPQSQLYSSPNWEIPFKSLQNPEINRILDSLPIIPFGEQVWTQIRSGFHGTYVERLFLPNSDWQVTRDNYPETVEIARILGRGSPNPLKINIPGNFLKRAFRKPENTQELYAKATHYVLSISPDAELPQEFEAEYLRLAEENLREAMASKRQRGGKETGKVPSCWYSHAYRNGAEKSIGHLWTFEKIYPIHRANLSTFSREPVTAPNMFHLIYGKDLDRLEVLHAWLNSTFFFCEYLLHAKSIRRGWLKCIIGHFKRLRVPDLARSSFSMHKIHQIQSTIRSVAKVWGECPPSIREQINSAPRRDLDFMWADLLEIPAQKQDPTIAALGEFVRQFIASR